MLEAEIGGQSVTWLAPHQFAQDGCDVVDVPLRLLRFQMVQMSLGSAFVASVEPLRFRLSMLSKSMLSMPGVRTCQQRWEMVGAACCSMRNNYLSDWSG